MRATEKPATNVRGKTARAPLVHIKPLYMAKPDVAAFLSLSESTVDLLVTRGGFPKPRKLSDGRAGWLVSELEEWGNERPVSDFLPPKNSGYGRAGAPAA